MPRPYLRTRLEVLLSVRGAAPVMTRDLVARNPALPLHSLIEVLAWLVAGDYVERVSSEGWQRTGKSDSDLREQARREDMIDTQRRAGMVKCTRCGVMAAREETVHYQATRNSKEKRLCLACAGHKLMKGAG